MYPKYVPWVFVTPNILGEREDGKLGVDVGWQRDSIFGDVIGAVVLDIEECVGRLPGAKGLNKENASGAGRKKPSCIGEGVMNITFSW